MGDEMGDRRRERMRGSEMEAAKASVIQTRFALPPSWTGREKLGIPDIIAHDQSTILISQGVWLIRLHIPRLIVLRPRALTYSTILLRTFVFTPEPGVCRCSRPGESVYFGCMNERRKSLGFVILEWVLLQTRFFLDLAKKGRDGR